MRTKGSKTPIKKEQKSCNTFSLCVYTLMKGNEMPNKNKNKLKGENTMVITDARVEMLEKILTNDMDFAKEIAEMEAEDAAKALQAKGFDFTAEELCAFVDDLNAFLQENGQLNEEDLDNVAGGHFYYRHRRPPVRYTHYHYGPYCVVVRYRW